jgi:hypothetical protein
MKPYVHSAARFLGLGGYISEADYDLIATERLTYTSKILDLATAAGNEVKDSPVVQVAVTRKSMVAVSTKPKPNRPIRRPAAPKWTALELAEGR